MAEEKYDSDFESDSDEENLLDINPEDIQMGDMIGGGGLGLVYSATWRNKNVAVKMLFDPRVNEALIKEFRDEAMVQWFGQLMFRTLVELILGSQGIRSPEHRKALCLLLETTKDGDDI